MTKTLKGIHRVTTTLADGSTVAYIYAWRGGPRLLSDPTSPKFVAEYRAALQRRTAASPRSIDALVRIYKESADFLMLRASTKAQYAKHLDEIRLVFGKMTISKLDDPATRNLVKQWRDRHAHTPRTADYRWSVLARICSFAKDRGLVARNPCERGGKLYRADRRDLLWSRDNLVRLRSCADDSVWRIVEAALLTGQRLGDLLGLTWQDVESGSITLRQRKTSARVRIPMHGRLRKLVDEGNRDFATIFARLDGTPWSTDQFSGAFRRARRRAGIAELRFHDLRGTAITLMAKAGCTVPEIASLSGHSLRTIHDVLDQHYLGDRTTLAAQAARKLELLTSDQLLLQANERDTAQRNVHFTNEVSCSSEEEQL